VHHAHITSADLRSAAAMYNYIVFGILAIAAALTVPQFVGTSVPPGAPPAAQSATVAAAPQPAQSSYGRTVTVRPDQRGHYNVEGRVDGRRMDFVVDTGATIIAIPQREAARLGIHPAARDYIAEIRTANGSVRGAPVRLAMVEVGGLIVRDVPAIVMPNQSLSENLLGMSFLSRLRRFEFAGGRLVLEQ
jgi:aspartyl protease family protein